MKNKIKAVTGSKVFVLIIILAVLIILFSVWSPHVGMKFLVPSTIRNILHSVVTTSFLTIGAGCLLISGNVDLAMSAIGCLGGQIIGNMIAKGAPWYLAILCGFIVCAIFGCIDGTLISKFKFPAFIATMGVSYIAKGCTYLFSAACNNGQALSLNYKHPVLDYLANGRILGLPTGVYVMIIFFLFYGIMLKRSKFGFKIRMVGGNPMAAKLAGINSEKIIFTLFINASIMGCISAIFNAAKIGQASLNALGSNQFTGMTAAMIGGISFGGGRGGMGGAFLGLLILNTFQVGMSTVGVNPFWVTTFSGILLIFALVSDQLQNLAHGLFSPRKKGGKA